MLLVCLICVFDSHLTAPQQSDCWFGHAYITFVTGIYNLYQVYIFEQAQMEM